MNIDYIFIEAKKELTLIISEIDKSNINEKQMEIENYLNFLKQATQLRISSETKNLNHSIQNDAEEVKGYPFVRKLKGGWLDGTEIFVPETVVRKLDLENGDLIFPKPRDEGQGKFFYELVEKNPCPAPNQEIGLVSFGKVARKDNFLMVSETIHGPIRIGEAFYEFLLKDDDILDHNLSEGDIIDIAYYKQNITKTAKVIWKYDSDSPELTRSPKPSSVYKDKIFTENDKETPKPLLKDKNILIVGCEFKKDDYKQLIESYEGTIDWIQGIEGYERIEAKVKKADCILLITTYIHHRASHLIVSLAKKWNKPFKDLKVTGNKTILDSIFQLLNIPWGDVYEY